MTRTSCLFDEIMMMSTFILDQHAQMEFHSANSLQQQSVSRHVVPFRHIIRILCQIVFASTPSCCVLSGETCIFFIVIVRTNDLPHLRRARHYTTDAVFKHDVSLVLPVYKLLCWYIFLLWIFSSEIYQYKKLTYEDIHYFYTLYLQLQRQILNKGTNKVKLWRLF